MTQTLPKQTNTPYLNFQLPASNFPLRIAIASSGLGHIARGIETWAADLATALHARGQNVTLFQSGQSLATSKTFQTSDFKLQTSAFPTISLPAKKRSDPATRRFLKITRNRLWRLGLGSAYDLEQTSFALRLLSHLRQSKIDILHVQDPRIALIVQRANHLHLVPTRVILGHGTEEPLAFQKKITYLQHLAPHHLTESRAAGVHKPTWTAIPNFIDTDQFSPVTRASCPPVNLRQELNLPQNALVVATVAAIKRHHKRIDYLLGEFAQLRAAQPQLPAYLLIAGGHEIDTDDLIRLGQQQLGDHVRFLVKFPRTRMPELYRSADLFTLCSLKEMMPIALLEATATGLPCITHPHPVMQWMTGLGGVSIDMSIPGTLADTLAHLLSNYTEREQLGISARAHCLANFSRDRVVDQILAYYQFVHTHNRTLQ